MSEANNAGRPTPNPPPVTPTPRSQEQPIRVTDPRLTMNPQLIQYERGKEGHQQRGDDAGRK